MVASPKRDPRRRGRGRRLMPTIRRRGACRAQVRLLRPTRIGSLPRSFHLHSPCYARGTISAICSMGVALATAPLSPTGSEAGAPTAPSGRVNLIEHAPLTEVFRLRLRPATEVRNRHEIQLREPVRILRGDLRIARPIIIARNNLLPFL